MTAEKRMLGERGEDDGGETENARSDAAGSRTEPAATCQ